MPGSLSLSDELLRFDRGRGEIGWKSVTICAQTDSLFHRFEIHQDAALCTEQGGKWVNLNQNFDNLLVAAALDRREIQAD